MKQNVREEIVKAFEETVVELMGMTIEESYALASKASEWSLKWLPHYLPAFASRKAMHEFFKSFPDEAEDQMQKIVLALRLLDPVFKKELSHFAHALAKDYPLTKPGRPESLGDARKREVIEFVGSLHTQGVTLTEAQDRAAKRFTSSLRSVQRTWRSRSEYASPKPQTFVELLSYFKTSLSSGDK